jgi:hypothetical protein
LCRFEESRDLLTQPVAGAIQGAGEQIAGSGKLSLQRSDAGSLLGNLLLTQMMVVQVFLVEAHVGSPFRADECVSQSLVAMSMARYAGEIWRSAHIGIAGSGKVHCPNFGFFG